MVRLIFPTAKASLSEAQKITVLVSVQMGLQTTIEAFFADALADGTHASELQTCLASCRARLEEGLNKAGVDPAVSGRLCRIASQLALIELMWRDVRATKKEESVATPYEKVDVWIKAEALHEMLDDIVGGAGRKGELLEAHILAAGRNAETALFEAFRVACRAGKGERYATAIPGLIETTPGDAIALDQVAARL